MPPGFGIIWTTVAVDLVGFGMVFPLLPLYARRFGASPATIGLLVASFSAAQFALAPVWGRLSDRIGRKPVLIMSLVGTAVASLATGLAGSIWLLFVARIVDGGSGGSLGVAHAAVTDLAEPAERPRLFGLLGAAFGVGFVAGPALASLSALGGPRLPFLIAAAIAAVNVVVAIIRLPETHPPSARQQSQADRAAPAAAKTSQRRVLVALGIATVCSISAFSAFEAVFALYANHRASLGLSGTGGVFAVIGLLIVVVQTQLVHRVVAWLGEAVALVSHTLKPEHGEAGGRARRPGPRLGPPPDGPLAGRAGHSPRGADRWAGVGQPDPFSAGGRPGLLVAPGRSPEHATGPLQPGPSHRSGLRRVAVHPTGGHRRLPGRGRGHRGGGGGIGAGGDGPRGVKWV